MNISFIPYHLTGKTFFAFEHAEKDGLLAIIGAKVTQKKDELDLSEHFIVDDHKHLSSKFTTATKVNLVITDSNVLNKEVNRTGTDQEILGEAYPNLDLNEFYYQILKTSRSSFVSVCRKKYIDAVIKQYQETNIRITHIDIGSIIISSVLPYFKDTELQTYNSSVSINDNEVFAIRNESNTALNYSIDSVSIPSTHTLPFASIVGKLTTQTTISGNLQDKNALLLKTYKESLFFKKTLQYGIAFLLISLLINFFIFNSNYKSWQQLQEEEQVYTSQKEAIQKQQIAVETKENIVQSIISTGFSVSSHHIDQLVQSLPETAILTSLNYQPITKTIRADKPIIINQNSIYISGDSSNKTNFTAWLDAIENLSFVQAVTTISYGMVKNNISNFEIEIIIINDTEE